MKDFSICKRHNRRRVTLYSVAILTSLIYCLALFFQPVSVRHSPAGFEFSNTQRILLAITVAVPIVLVWFFGAAAIAGALLRADESTDDMLKKLFRSLGLSIGFLIMGLISGILLGEVKLYYSDTASVQRLMTILVNYTYVFPPLVGFFILYRGTHNRNGNGKHAFIDQNGIVATVLVAVVGVLWTGVIFTNAGRQTSSIMGISPSFYLSDGGIIASIIIPTLFSWFFGIRSALALTDVSLQIGDSRRALSHLISGIWLLIFSYIVVLGLLSAGAERLLALGRVGLLILIYAFLMVLLTAHWLIARSIKRMGTQEESVYK